MPNSPVAVLDALLSLHDAEQGSVFRLMTEDSPYVTKAPADVREPLTKLHDVNARHREELAGAIRHLGGVARQRPAANEPLLEFLSLKFLLPKLVHEKELMARRYENALRALPKTTPAEVTDLLHRQRSEQVSQVDALTDTAGRVITAGK